MARWPRGSGAPGRRRAACRPCCGGWARCSSTPSRCWRVRTSWWRTPVTAPSAAMERRTGAREPHVRVLVSCRMRAAARGLAVVRVQAPGLPGQGSAGTASRTGQACAEVVARLRGEGPLTPTSSGGPRRAGRGGTGRRPRSPPSGCSTWASSSVASGGGSSGSTTWPSAPSPPSAGVEWTDEECASGSCRRPGVRSGWRPSVIWPSTTDYR